MYILVKNGQVEQYPYSLNQLKKDHPQVSFPSNPSDGLLQAFDVYRCLEVSQPEVNHTQNVEQGFALVNSEWTQVWTVVNASAEEITQRLANQWTNVRSDRNKLLAATDWTQIYDAPVEPMAWTGYRQALRDITTQADPFNIVWPVAPSA